MDMFLKLLCINNSATMIDEVIEVNEKDPQDGIVKKKTKKITKEMGSATELGNILYKNFSLWPDKEDLGRRKEEKIKIIFEYYLNNIVYFLYKKLF